MKVGIAGGTGFVGRHLTKQLLERGHEVVVMARGKDPGKDEFSSNDKVTFVQASLAQAPDMVRAVRDCGAVYNLVGINREKGDQTYATVHMEGTRNLMSVLRQAKIDRIIHVSFLTARAKASPYHVSKWNSEETVRHSGLKYTIFRPGVLYGEGDQFLSHLKKTLKTMPFFGLLGHEPQPLSPLHIDDFSRVLAATLEREDTFGKTFAMVGPDSYSLGEIVDKVGKTINVVPNKFPMPVVLHRVMAGAMELLMENPLLTNAQVSMLCENLTGPMAPCDPLPLEFRAQTPFLGAKQQAEKVERDISKIAEKRGVELSDEDIEV